VAREALRDRFLAPPRLNELCLDTPSCSTNGGQRPNAAMLQALSAIQEIRKGINPKTDPNDYLREARAGAMYGFGDD
jgi:hypothetical protein